MRKLLLPVALAVALTIVHSKPQDTPTVSPDFLDLHYLPQQNCKCGDAEQCAPIYVSLKRERASLVKSGGSGGRSTVVELIREKIREIPSHSVVYSETEVIEVQKVPEPLFVPVTLKRQVYEEEIDYYEVWIPKVEVNYIYRDVHVYPEVEEPVARANIREEKLPVPVVHRPVHFNETTFEVPLIQEYLVSKDGPAVDVEEKIEILDQRVEQREAIVQCESLRYVPVACYPPGQKIPGVFK